MMKSKQGKVLYAVTLLFIVLSGFAQMPIFKRYYIADIPGLGWLAQFYVTHILHYMMAVVLIAMIAYFLSGMLFNRRTAVRLTVTGTVKIGLLAGLILTGALMVIKNFPGVFFGHSLIIGLDIMHLLFCMALIFISAYTAWRKKPWAAG